jgi:hypothetical protein
VVVLEKKEPFLNRQNAMRTMCAAKGYGAHIVRIFFLFCVLFGAGAQRLLRFGGSNPSL